ncbi:ubiquinol-cytochrome C chaperone family protein [Breoghania sp. L-A4]|uniref:ubiquinol-cytochrome C chaperone family protein n=1 Tax=Breoghania sp. L-A4 TaxID=2304600 RepID=UPI000E35CE7F|nr:ubiquinol-cytochrome C chaperone family protein [Breoghania sp. L-A4]AXS40270.1 ubiquinol-cytochrome C chaperone [Breoghania sp. L-A4]
MIFNFFRRGRNDPAVTAVYVAIVAQARQPHFYARLGVPDTLEGRFDMMVLHAVLLFHRFSGEGAAARDFGQKVFDTFFLDMDRSLRELGASDEGMKKKITRMAEVFYGCADAYASALDAGDDAALALALDRNVFMNAPDGAQTESRSLADYTRAASGALAAQDPAAIVAGTLTWIDPAPFGPRSGGTTGANASPERVE